MTVFALPNASRTGLDSRIIRFTASTSAALPLTALICCMTNLLDSVFPAPLSPLEEEEEEEEKIKIKEKEIITLNVFSYVLLSQVLSGFWEIPHLIIMHWF